MAEPAAVLEFDGIVRQFDGGAGVHDVSLRVAPGEIHALVGLNGAGKTTLLRLALGILRPQQGQTRLFGVPVAQLPPARWAEVGAQIEYPMAYPELRVRTNLELAGRLRLVAPDQLATTTAAAIDEFGLNAYVDVRSRRLSLGNRQRLGLACALQHAPRVIVLDEPTNALDPDGIVVTRDALRRRADAGAGVLVSSHHLDEVARIADRITVINDGRVVGTLDPAGSELERAFFAMIHPGAAA